MPRCLSYPVEERGSDIVLPEDQILPDEIDLIEVHF
jgi:hypothetical protein